MKTVINTKEMCLIQLKKVMKREKKEMKMGREREKEEKRKKGRNGKKEIRKNTPLSSGDRHIHNHLVHTAGGCLSSSIS